MSVSGRLALAIFLSACLVRTAAASCTSHECPNDSIVDPVRQLIAASCDCEGTKSHNRYLRCAKEVIKGAVKAHTLPSECKTTVRRCEAKSTCGISGAAVCCVPKGAGKIKALVTKKESRCKHGSMCTGPLAAADACKPDGTCNAARRGLKSFRSVQKLFTTSCALSSCHSALARQGGLVLDTEGISYSNLVGRPAVLPEAQQQGLVRVKPGDPDGSFLIRKLRGLGPGTAMPQAGGPLPDPLIGMVADWIRRGAKTTAEECPPRADGKGTICDDDGTPEGNYVWHPEPALEVPAPNEGIQLYAPPRDVAPGTEWETCYAVHPDWVGIAMNNIGLPAGQLPTIKEQVYRMHAGSHHMLLYMYVGQDPNGWAQGYFPCNAANCLNKDDCPSDADTALLIPVGGTQVAGTRYDVKYPEGVGVPILSPNAVLIINEHYTNPFQPPQPIYGEAWLNLYLDAPGEFKVILDGIFAINSRDLLVEPFQTRTISSIWQPHGLLGGATDAAVFQLFGHMHKRGTLFQIDNVKGGACSVSGNACGRDDDCACKPWQNSCTPGQTCVRQPGAEDTTVYQTDRWDLAPIDDFPPPYFLVNQNEGLRWTCTHVNGVQGDPTRPPKTCEEGCAACGWDPPSGTCHFCKSLAQPGLVWSPDLQSCTGRDGTAVATTPRVFALGEPMPLVFGLLADDDMCNMFGYFIHQSDLPKLQ